MRRLHEKLFYRPLLDAVSRLPPRRARLSAEAAAARLGALGWASPEGALHHLRALTGGVSRAAAIQQTLLPVLLDELARSPDPDRGLLAYRRVSEALATTPWYLRLLRDEGLVARAADAAARARPRWSRTCSCARRRCCGCSPRPAPGQADELTRDPANAAASLRATVGPPARPRTPPRPTARSLRRHEMLRIACADLLGKLDVEQVCSGAVARSGSRCCRRCSRSVVRALGGPDAAGPARGDRDGPAGRRPSWATAATPTSCSSASRSTARPTTRPSSTRRPWPRRSAAGSAAPSPDPALVVDADLRPGGPVRAAGPHAGLLPRATTPAGRRPGRRRRCCGPARVAGDADLGRRFIELIDPIRYPDGRAHPRARSPRSGGSRRGWTPSGCPAAPTAATHTKLGHGGLADVEWTVQLLQLQHAGDIPELRTTSTLDGLREAAEAGLITHDDAEELAAGWMMATRARNAVMLVRGKPGDQLPRSGRELAAVAAALGYPADGDPGVFLDDYRRATRRARAVVERVFYGW